MTCVYILSSSWVISHHSLTLVDWWLLMLLWAGFQWNGFGRHRTHTGMMMSFTSSLLYAVQHPTLLCVIISLHMLFCCRSLAARISSGLFHVFCVLLLSVIAAAQTVRTNWTPTRTMMSYWHSSLQQPAASTAIPSACNRCSSARR